MSESSSDHEHITYKISYNTALQNKKHGITNSVKDLIEELYFEIGKGKKSTIKRLNRAIKKYPKVPQFKNYLSKEYHAAGNEQKSIEVTDRILAEHPDYLFGKLNKANSLIQEEKTERVPEFLGEEMELQALYPERDEFHIDEVLNYYSTTVIYFLETGDREQAVVRIDLLEQLDPQAHATQIARNRLMIYDMTENLEKSRQIWEYDQKHERTVKSRGYRRSTQTDKKPDFHHSEIDYLYTNGFDITEEKIREILALPEETLVTDLETVLEDAVNRHEVLKEEIMQGGWNYYRHNFGSHAVFLLAEMESTQSLPSVIELLRQGEEFLDFWFGDRLEEFFSLPVATLAENQLSLLDEFLKEPYNSSYARNIAVSATESIARQNPEKRDIIVNMYEDWIRFLIKNEEDHSLFDTELLGFIVWSCLNLNADSLLPLIKQLYQKNMVPINMLGTYKEVERDMLQKSFLPETESFDIYSHYKKIHTNQLYNKPDSGSDYQPLPATPSSLPSFGPSGSREPTASPWKDVGRNDPCPCGSGRKYKRCCLR
jgi:tetratricopeptide (TPR) repeat protein